VRRIANGSIAPTNDRAGDIRGTDITVTTTTERTERNTEATRRERQRSLDAQQLYYDCDTIRNGTDTPLFGLRGVREPLCYASEDWHRIVLIYNRSRLGGSKWSQPPSPFDPASVLPSISTTGRSRSSGQSTGPSYPRGIPA